MNTTVSNSLATDAQRFWNSLMTLAAIGATDKGGVCRLLHAMPGHAGIAA